jgi:hypothetical protein
MEFLGDLGCVEPRLSPFGDKVSVDARWVLGLRETYNRLKNHVGHT